MKILLSGSTSFLGTKFIELYSSKFDITGFSRSHKQNSVDMTDKGKLRQLYQKVKPDVIVHLAAIVDANGKDIIEVNKEGTSNIVEFAKSSGIPIVFMSSESIYGGKQNGGYVETDKYNPRSDYAKSKVESEKVIIESGLPYLILRGHRFVGVSDNYHRPKQFPDALGSLRNNTVVHADSRKIFRASYINHLCEVIEYHIDNHLESKEVLNVVLDKDITYYQLLVDLANSLGLDTSLVKDDGSEDGWPPNSTLSVEKLKDSNYPQCAYQELLNSISF